MLWSSRPAVANQRSTLEIPNVGIRVTNAIDYENSKGKRSSSDLYSLVLPDQICNLNVITMTFRACDTSADSEFSETEPQLTNRMQHNADRASLVEPTHEALVRAVRDRALRYSTDAPVESVIWLVENEASIVRPHAEQGRQLTHWLEVYRLPDSQLDGLSVRLENLPLRLTDAQTEKIESCSLCQPIWVAIIPCLELIILFNMQQNLCPHIGKRLLVEWHKALFQLQLIANRPTVSMFVIMTSSLTDSPPLCVWCCQLISISANQSLTRCQLHDDPAKDYQWGILNIAQSYWHCHCSGRIFLCVWVVTPKLSCLNLHRTMALHDRFTHWWSEGNGVDHW
jgi:hypothetical protein